MNLVHIEEEAVARGDCQVSATQHATPELQHLAAVLLVDCCGETVAHCDSSRADRSAASLSDSSDCSRCLQLPTYARSAKQLARKERCLGQHESERSP